MKEQQNEHQATHWHQGTEALQVHPVFANVLVIQCAPYKRWTLDKCDEVDDLLSDFDVEDLHCVVVEDNVLSREGTAQAEHAEVGEVEVVGHEEAHLYQKLERDWKYHDGQSTMQVRIPWDKVYSRDDSHEELRGKEADICFRQAQQVELWHPVGEVFWVCNDWSIHVWS